MDFNDEFTLNRLYFIQSLSSKVALPNGKTKPPFWSAKQNLISSSEKIEDKNWAMKINIF